MTIMTVVLAVLRIKGAPAFAPGLGLVQATQV
jgi:hypothetical protein